MDERIIVEHQLNVRTKPHKYLSSDFYPLNIYINIFGKTINLKSRISEYLKIYTGQVNRLTKGDKELSRIFISGLFSQQWLEEIVGNKKFPVYHLLSDEIDVIKKIIEMKINRERHIDLSKINRLYENYIKEITDVIDEYIKKSFLDELKSLFLNTIDKQDKRDLFKIANYFIHYINWNHPFYDIYDATTELMPVELKKLENHITPKLKLSIRAYTAYYSYINPLKRFFEKREKGRIATLSYLDWQSDIKALITKQFSSMLGNKTARQYVGQLDEILNYCLK